jgi:hypothetical protein
MGRMAILQGQKTRTNEIWRVDTGDDGHSRCQCLYVLGCELRVRRWRSGVYHESDLGVTACIVVLGLGSHQSRCLGACGKAVW